MPAGLLLLLPLPPAPAGFSSGKLHRSEGGMIRSETLIELRSLNSTFSSLSSY